MTTMKRMRNDHRRNFTKLETEVIPKGETFIEIRKRVKNPNYVSFKSWARTQEVQDPSPKLQKILSVKS